MRTWLSSLLFVLPWADLIRQLSYQWHANDQYAYGWFVPFLAMGLFWKRWLDRPSPTTANSRWLMAPVILVALWLLPLRVVYEINPDWPLPAWLFALSIVGLTFHAVYRMGGWPWVRHFAFPLCFILVAVPWPYRIEHGLTQKLMRVVAFLTVEVLGWFNIPAVQQGNLIEISAGVIGIDEACSGIRSFQSTLMGGLFLGELYRLRGAGRTVLLLGGVLLAFSFNIVRTLLLTWQSSTAGLEVLEKWHDSAGMTIFFTSFACLWGTALGMRRREGRHCAESISLRKPFLIPKPFLIAIGCWTAAVLVLTETWYRWNESKDPGAFHWSANFPADTPGYETVELSERVRRNIRSDLSEAAHWMEPDGRQWSAFFFRWNPGPIRSILRARLHRPDVCLPASGWRQIADVGLASFPARGLEIPFRRYAYETEGGIRHVFYCQWEDGAERQMGLQASKGADRLRAVLVGRRYLGQQTLQLIMSGYPSLEDAEVALRKRLPDLIKTESPPAISTARKDEADVGI